MDHTSDRINTDRIIHYSKEAIHYTVKEKDNDPEVLPRGSDEPVIEIEIQRVTCDPFDIIAAIEIDRALAALLGRVVEANVEAVSILVYSIPDQTHCSIDFESNLTSISQK
jgi:hypothetical protein